MKRLSFIPTFLAAVSLGAAPKASVYFIAPEPAKVASALEAWSWIGVSTKKPIRVTAFADVFLQDKDGIWFLDSVEGKLKRVCATTVELDALLKTEEGKDAYLFAGFVERAHREGLTLGSGECYSFKINPVLGGAMDYRNIEKQDFVVALHIAGQIHEQVRNLPPGTKISELKIDGAPQTAKEAQQKKK
jgi:hypothetical protein